MHDFLKLAHFALVASVGFSAPNVQAAEVSPEQPQMAAAEHCLKAMGIQDVQPIREMAKEMSPEVILDRVFSSVEPDFQKALLSKPVAPGKPVKQPEAMRDPKYFLPAIATMQMPFNWIRVMADGRIIEPASKVANRDPNWTRVADEQQKKPLPLSLPVPQRY